MPTAPSRVSLRTRRAKAHGRPRPPAWHALVPQDRMRTMNRLLSMLLLCMLTSLGASAWAAPPWFAGQALPVEHKERLDSLRLRELRLKEAVERGELSREEARRLRQYYRRHDAVRLPLPPEAAENQPDGRSGKKDWHRWRKKQDRLNAVPFNEPD